MEVVLGDYTTVKVIEQEIVIFQREFRESMIVKDVVCVHGLKKNLISVSTMEDRGYVVIFQDGKFLILLRVFSGTIVSVIGVRCENLYMLDFSLSMP